MQYILITNSFKKNLKKLKKYYTGQDIIDDIKDFAINGLRKSETYLKSILIDNGSLNIAKLRITIRMVRGRYLLGILESQEKIEYLPIIIDLKKGKHGKNLSFLSNKNTVKAINQAIINTVDDYVDHTKINPTMDIYEI
jgi:hypothetical protein